MIEFIEKLWSNKLIRQFVSYLFVGGVATMVEWVLFYVFDSWFHINYLLATALAFTLSTGANWVLGRLTTFKEADKPGRGRELIQIYAVSVVGLLANLGLMYLFVDVCAIHSMISKILATIIVFAWNFLSRKILIYKV